MKRFYVVGGTQTEDAASRDEWDGTFDRGIILEVDLDSGRVQRCAEHVTPPSARPEGRCSILFKAATVENHRLYACTQTEVIVYRVPEFEVEHYISHPCFNDVHHVRPYRSDRLLVANTGLDMVVEVTLDGKIVREWSAIGEDPWARFSRQTDYRRLPTTKPHLSHPNFTFFLHGDIWVTRFEQRDAICLTSDGRFDIGVERVHDGIVNDDIVYFTSVNGHVIGFDANNHRSILSVDLNAIVRRPSAIALGWCRGLCVLDSEHVLVGFSRLRETRFRENLRWLANVARGRTFTSSLPTRISEFDLKTGELCREFALEDYGMSAVFSIHRSDRDSGQE
jgi:hypothetical protein